MSLFAALHNAVNRVRQSGSGALDRVDNMLWRARRKMAFRKNHGHAANLDAPRSFSEKLFKRILDGHDPQYPVYAIKRFAHHFVRAQHIPGLKVARHLKVVRHMTSSDFEDLPQAFVIKSSFGSGLNEVVTDKSKADIPALCHRFNTRLPLVRNARNERDPYNAILFEAFIGDPSSGRPPDDYKFHCFNRQDGTHTCFIQVDSARLGEHRQTLFDAQFNVLDMDFSGQVRHETAPERPAALADMLRIARELSSGFDYIRVDLFHTDDGVYFGELTPFHRGGTARIMQPEWEARWGELWDQRFPDFQPK